MGSGRYDTGTFASYSSTAGYASATTPQDIFTQRHISQALDPRGVAVRESRDSADNPASTPIIVALDITGSMSAVLMQMAQSGMNRLMAAIYERRPVTDPHVMVMGIGDAEAGDQAPLQVSQFEADIRIIQQQEQVWLEGGGGGNHYESYALAWYFAAYHTATDAWERRGRKGFLFTVGDEQPTPALRARDIERVLGARPPNGRGLSGAALLAAARERWEVYHLIVAEGSHARGNASAVRGAWRELMGDRALWLADHRHLSEVVVSALQVAAGLDAASVASGWDGDASASVRRAFDFGASA